MILSFLSTRRIIRSILIHFLFLKSDDDAMTGREMYLEVFLGNDVAIDAEELAGVNGVDDRRSDDFSA